MKTSHRVIFAVFLLFIGVGGRMFFYTHEFVPNVETLTVTVLLAGALLGGTYALGIAILTIGITDMLIGNDVILIFTWSAWMIIAIFGLIFHGRKVSFSAWTLGLTGLGLGANIFFYVWTNFGVWAVGRMYPLTWDGLMTSYIAGLPFLRYQMLGNIIFIPVVASVFYVLARNIPVSQPEKKESILSPID